MGRNEASATVFCLNLASLYFRHYNIGIAIISSAILSSLYLFPLFFLRYNFGNPVIRLFDQSCSFALVFAGTEKISP